MFWIFVAGMTAAAVLAVLWPLARRAKDTRSGKRRRGLSGPARRDRPRPEIRPDRRGGSGGRAHRGFTPADRRGRDGRHNNDSAGRCGDAPPRPPVPQEAAAPPRRGEEALAAPPPRRGSGGGDADLRRHIFRLSQSGLTQPPRAARSCTRRRGPTERPVDRAIGGVGGANLTNS